MNPEPASSPDPVACERLHGAYVAVERAERFLRESFRPEVSGWYVRLSFAEGFWSPEVFGLFGLQTAEKAPAASEGFRHLVDEDRRRLFAMSQRAFRHGDVLDVCYRVRGRDGSVRVVHSRGHAISALTGEERALIGIVTDVTRRGEAQLALHAAREALGACLGDFAGAKPASSRAIIDAASRRVTNGKTARGLTPEQIRRVERLVEERLATPLPVADMARAVGLSCAGFARAFRQTTGETPHQFVLRVRLERASAAMATSPRKLASIAVDFGFFDQAHFTRLFRKRFGTTPGEAARRVFST